MYIYYLMIALRKPSKTRPGTILTAEEKRGAIVVDITLVYENFVCCLSKSLKGEKGKAYVLFYVSWALSLSQNLRMRKYGNTQRVFIWREI